MTSSARSVAGPARARRGGFRRPAAASSPAPCCPAACGSSPRRCPACAAPASASGCRSARATRRPRLAGTSHFLEHLLFKGTTSRSALDIASAMDAVGGEFNAFTEKEHTCYYATVLDRDLAAGDRHRERRRAQRHGHRAGRRRRTQRRARRDRDARRRPVRSRPRRVRERAVRDTPLGRPILGTVESIDGADPPPGRRLLPPPLHTRRDGGRRWPATSSTPRSCAWCGRRSPSASTAPATAAAAAVAVGRGASAGPPRSRWSTTTPSRPTWCWACSGCRATTRAGLRLGVLSSALGGGMSSRLFQRIREERGLAYSVYSFATSYADAGQFGVYAGCQPGKADEVLGLMVAELRRGRRRRADRRRDRTRQGPDARRPGARPRGLRLADDPHRQERARPTATCSASTSCWPRSMR